MLNADFSIQDFTHGKSNEFTPSASCTVNYEVRANYLLNNATGKLELQKPGINVATLDASIGVDVDFTQQPFWIRLVKVGNNVKCYYQAGESFPNTWGFVSGDKKIHGWDGQTVLNEIIGPKYQSGIYLDAHSLEGIEVIRYKQITP